MSRFSFNVVLCIALLHFRQHCAIDRICPQLCSAIQLSVVFFADWEASSHFVISIRRLTESSYSVPSFHSSCVCGCVFIDHIHRLVERKTSPFHCSAYNCAVRFVNRVSSLSTAFAHTSLSSAVKQYSFAAVHINCDHRRRRLYCRHLHCPLRSVLPLGCGPYPSVLAIMVSLRRLFS